MKRFTYGLLSICLLGFATLVSMSGSVAEASGQAKPAHKIDDQAELFSKDAKEKANEQIAKLKTEHNKDLVIETFKKIEIPTGLSKDQVKKFLDQFAEKRFKVDDVQGVYVLIATDPHEYRVSIGKKTRDDKLFSVDDRKELEKILAKGLPGDKDAVLLSSVKFVSDTISKHAPAPVANKKQPDARHPAAAPTAEVNWTFWIIVGIVGLLVFWLIMGVIRAATAPRGYGGGPGMAGGGGGYGGGGGGGGFFPSLMGGLFGAAAGMWMYSHFFGGASQASSPMGDGGQTSTGGGDYAADQGEGGVGSTGGGGWGDDDKQISKDDGGGDTGGGDWGGGGGGDTGGGDWGGGGDTGGGDWGGGGGDFGGGGGGGDW